MGLFECDECESLCVCLLDLDGQLHTVPKEMDSLGIDTIFSWTLQESLGFLRADRDLIQHLVCGTWQRTTIDEIVKGQKDER